MSKIRIGPLDYKIKTVIGLNENGQKIDGQVHHWKSLIRLEQEMNAQCTRETLWHEVLHAILTQAGYSEQNEAMLEAISHGVMGVLRDNPWMREL